MGIKYFISYYLKLGVFLLIKLISVFTAVEHAEDEDQLTLLPCLICNEFYHDQISLDKHVANDHEPFATRRPFSDKTVKFDIPNIQHAAMKSIPDLILEFIPPTPAKR